MKYHVYFLGMGSNADTDSDQVGSSWLGHLVNDLT